MRKAPSEKNVRRVMDKVLGDFWDKIQYENSPPKCRFPDGLRYHYYKDRKKKGYQERWFCWSLRRNENGKFVSWVYKWKWIKKRKGSRATFHNVVEHRRKKDAEKRAYRLLSERRKDTQSDQG